MAGNRKEIDSESVYIGVNFADGLCGIGVEEDAMLMGDAGAILDRLDGADLIVGMHDADKHRAAAYIAVRRSSGSTRPVRSTGRNVIRAPSRSRNRQRFDNRRVLDPGRDDVIALVAEREENALERKVVGLAAAAGEDDLVAVAPKQGRHLAACRLDSGLCSS